MTSAPQIAWPLRAALAALALLAVGGVGAFAALRFRDRARPAACAGAPRLKAAFPVRLDAGGKCLLRADGASLYLVGDSAWSLLVVPTEAQVDAYLADRRARGFNALLVNLIEHKFGGPTDAEGNAPFLAPGDLSRPNERYFARAERIVRRAGEQGFLVLLAPAYLGVWASDEGWFKELVAAGPERAREYGRMVGRRFAQVPNVLWVEGGDRTPDEAAPLVDAVAQGIREMDRAHLHTAHSGRSRSALDDYARPWLSLNSTYVDCRTLVGRLRTDRRRGLPFFLIEGVYENEGADLACLSDQVWAPLLLGARGAVSGNAPLWKFGRGWEQALDTPGARIQQHLVALLAQRPLPGLWHEPFSDAVFEGALRNRALVARAADGTVLAYLPRGVQHVTVDAAHFAAARLHAFWLDPISGSGQRAGRLDRGKQLELRPPGDGPWVLVVEDAALNRPAPGLR